MNYRKFPRTLALAVVAMQTGALQYAADVVHLTLPFAVHMALSQNRALKIARLKVTENEHRKAAIHSAYFLRSQTNPMRCISPICSLSTYRREDLES